jgi:hypothetical protein
LKLNNIPARYYLGLTTWSHYAGFTHGQYANGIPPDSRATPQKYGAPTSPKDKNVMSVSDGFEVALNKCNNCNNNWRLPASPKKKKTRACQHCNVPLHAP